MRRNSGSFFLPAESYFSRLEALYILHTHPTMLMMRLVHTTHKVNVATHNAHTYLSNTTQQEFPQVKNTKTSHRILSVVSSRQSDAFPTGNKNYLNLFRSWVTSRCKASFCSVISSTSRCSFRFPALARDTSSSVSSNCLFSPFMRLFSLSAWKKRIISKKNRNINNKPVYSSVSIIQLKLYKDKQNVVYTFSFTLKPVKSRFNRFI